MLTLRPYAGEADWSAIANVMQADPLFAHRLDYSWRLASPSLDEYDNAAVWEDGDGTVQAFAALQFPWLTLDYAIRPDVRTPDREGRVLDWAENRLAEIARKTGRHFPFNVDVFDFEQNRQHILQERNYGCREGYLVGLTQSLEGVRQPVLPQGFVIRPLGAQDVAGYVDLHRLAFHSSAMTNEWRSRTLRSPLHRPELDLLLVAPNGQLVGFCVWWYDPHLKTAQLEPLGVHLDFHKLGLSQALIFYGMAQLVQLGAKTVQVEAYTSNEVAIKAYTAAGFDMNFRVLQYFKEY